MRARVNGIQMAFTEEGNRTPLVFLHGFPFHRGVWSKQVEAFKDSHRVIAPDLRGFGESETTSGSVPMVRFAEDVHALLQYLDTGPVTLVGHSMGGYVALAFAKTYPQALQGLVLVGTRAGADTAEGAAARRAMAAKVRAKGTSVVVDALAPRMLSIRSADPAMAAAVVELMSPSKPQGIIGALLGMADRPDARDWIPDIRVRTLLVAGKEDQVIPPGESETMMLAISGAQMKLIPGAGHLVAFERSSAFNEALRVWLSWGGEEHTHGFDGSVDMRY